MTLFLVVLGVFRCAGYTALAIAHANDAGVCRCYVTLALAESAHVLSLSLSRIEWKGQAGHVERAGHDTTDGAKRTPSPPAATTGRSGPNAGSVGTKNVPQDVSPSHPAVQLGGEAEKVPLGPGRSDITADHR
jgi:hypothetical protein